MKEKTTESLGMNSLVLAFMIDFGLLANYVTLSNDNIDAMWNLPFLLTWPAAFLALLSLVAFGLYVKPRSKGYISASVVAFVVAVSLELLTRNYLFIW